ncbi:hypothetical protein [Symbiopectobacterium sp. RP]|uniref:hypothetical protein n=1 Tax=Symbiopectobacterium sp. RP TaxID=3248553 RepID=UPI003D29094E
MWQKNTANCYQNNVAWLYSMKSAHRDEGSGLPEYRKARAMQIQMEIAEKTFQ